MNTELRGGDPYRPARDDRETLVARVLDKLPGRVEAALGGDLEALINLLVIAADVAWQGRAEVLGTVEEVAADAHRFADAVADCYSEDRAPSDLLCDIGFALADRVDALAIEVLLRRRQTGGGGDAELPQHARPAAREARHLARAHVAALRDAARGSRVVNGLDVEAAEDLYRSIVAIGRQQTARAVRAALGDPVQPPALDGGSPPAPS